MRLLHILSQRPGRSGSGVFLGSMVREAARRGYEQHVIAAGPPGTSSAELPPLAAGELTPIVFPSPEAPFPVPGNSDVMPYPSTVFSQMSPLQVEQYLTVSRRVMESVRASFRPDLVHAHHLWMMTALARRVFAGLPMVATSHNAELRQMVKAPHLAPRVVPELRAIDRVCVLTARSRQDTVECFGIEPGRIEVTGAGYRDDLFHVATASRAALLDELRRDHGIELPPGSGLVTFIARLSTPKGVPFLLEAVRRLAADRRTRPFKLLLVGASGSGGDGRRMDALVRDMGDVVMHLGAWPQEVVARILQVSDLFVLPSLFEGLPLVMLEAAACGCPCVVSALPTIDSWVPEEWRASGDFELVPALATTRADQPVETDVPRFVDDLAAALARQLEKPRSEAARRLQAARLAGHSWAAVFERYERVYHQLARAPIRRAGSRR